MYQNGPHPETDTTKCWGGLEQQELSLIAGGTAKRKTVQPLWKTVATVWRSFLQN